MNSLKNHILVLRLNRLSHLPPAQQATELLQESGLPVMVAEFGELGEPGFTEEGGISKWKISPPWLARIPSKIRPLFVLGHAAMTLLGGIARWGRPRWIIAHGIQEQILALFLNLVWRVSYVVHVHEVFERDEVTALNRFFLGFEGLALSRAEFLIFPESTRAEIYGERYGLKQKIFLCFNCPRLRKPTKHADLRKAYGIPAEAKILVYLGGIGKTNALVEAVDAVAALSDVYFFIAGWGDRDYLDSLKTAVRKNAVEERVFFLGSLGAHEKWSVLDQADASYCVYHPIFLRLKYGATASNKLMEALASGLPVLTSEAADFKTLVETWDVGTCVKITVEGIRRGLEDLLYDRISGQRRRKNALEAHSSQLNFEHQFAPVRAALTEPFEPPNKISVPAFPIRKTRQ